MGWVFLGVVLGLFLGVLPLSSQVGGAPWSVFVFLRRVAERHATAALYRRRRSVGLIDDQVLLRLWLGLDLVVHGGLVEVEVVGSEETVFPWQGVEVSGLRGEEVTGLCGWCFLRLS